MDSKKVKFLKKFLLGGEGWSG